MTHRESTFSADNADAARPLIPTSSEYSRTFLGRLDARFLQNAQARTILLVLLGVVLIVPTVQSIDKIQETQHSAFRKEGERRRTALGRWLPTIELLQDESRQKSPYGFGHWFPLPPTILVALQPLTHVPPGVAAGIWGLLKILGVVFSFGFLVRGMRTDQLAVPLGVVVIAFFFSMRAPIADLQHANVNLFVLVWVAATLGCFMRGQDVWAGVFLSLAIITKITPALLVVYFAYKRSWKLCVVASLGVVVWFLLLPGAYLGWAKNLGLLGEWFEMLISPFLVHGYTAGEIANQSLYGVTVRIAENIGWPPVQRMPLQEAMDAGMTDMLKPVGVSRWVLRAITTLPILGVLAWQCRTPSRWRRDPRVILEFGLVLLAMLLLSERTWKHHATTLPIVYLGVWYVLACVPMSDRLRNWHTRGLIVQIILLQGSTSGIVGDRLADRLLDGGVFCWGLVLCFVQTAWLLGTLHKQIGRKCVAKS